MGRMSISVYMKGYYEEFYGFGLRKNKANQSQFQVESGSVLLVWIIRMLPG